MKIKKSAKVKEDKQKPMNQQANKKQGFFARLFKGMNAPESAKTIQTKGNKKLIKGITQL